MADEPTATRVCVSDAHDDNGGKREPSCTNLIDARSDTTLLGWRDEILQDGIGRDLLRAHAALRRADAAATADWSIESEVRRFSEVW